MTPVLYRLGFLDCDHFAHQVILMRHWCRSSFISLVEAANRFFWETDQRTAFSPVSARQSSMETSAPSGPNSAPEAVSSSATKTWFEALSELPVPLSSNRFVQLPAIRGDCH